MNLQWSRVAQPLVLGFGPVDRKRAGRFELPHLFHGMESLASELRAHILSINVQFKNITAPLFQSQLDPVRGCERAQLPLFLMGLTMFFVFA